MLSLIVLSAPGSAVHVRLQGELTYADLPLLQQFSRSCLEQGTSDAWLDVQDLWNIDAFAMRALRALPGQGLAVHFCRPGIFLRQLLLGSQLQDWIAQESPRV